MQILIFSLLILLLIIYLVYKVKKRFTSKDLKNLLIAISIVIAGLFLYDGYLDEKIPNAFKEKYLKEKNIEILKLTYSKTSVEAIQSNKSKYSFSYIINKDGKDLICEANNVEIIIIENETIVSDFKEKCQDK